MKDLVIDRKMWLRGEGNDNSLLLRQHDGKMCCFGFLALECGYTKDDINQKPSPNDLLDGYDRFKFPSDLLFKDENSFFCCGIMRTNDSTQLTEQDREKRLIELFSTMGYNLIFEG